MSTTLTTPADGTTVETPPVPQAPPTLTQQTTDRSQIYEKYYGGNPPGPESTPPTEPTAQVVPPVDVTPPPSVATLPPEFAEAFSAMQQELVALRTAVRPVAPTEPLAPLATDPSWVSLLREGKIEEAEAALVAAVAKKVGPDTVQQSVTQAREIARAEADIESFVKDIRTTNPDLVPLEKLITIEANETLERLRAEGKIKTTDDTVREYKKAVSASVENARKLYQTLRGSGKQEAMVRSREVLSTSPLAPSAVDTQRTPQGPPQELQPESPEAYFEKRRAVDSWRKGLASKPDFLKE